MQELIITYLIINIETLNKSLKLCENLIIMLEVRERKKEKRMIYQFKYIIIQKAEIYLAVFMIITLKFKVMLFVPLLQME